MKSPLDRTVIAFSGHQKVASGPLSEVVLSIKKHSLGGGREPLLVFDDQTSAPVELDLRGSAEKVLQRIREASCEPASESGESPVARTGPGRPKLGVMSREISLLPRHWEWLALQRGGASATLRRLVDEAKKKNPGQDRARQSQESTHRFMTAMAGDFPYFEEALRALYAGKRELFGKLIIGWPEDVREQVLRLARAAFSGP